MSEGKTELDVSVEEVTHAVAEITKMDRVIAELTQKYQGVIFDVSTRKGLTGAKEARKEIREPRYVIENLRKAGKKPILELGRQLDGRAKEMTERLLTLEAPVHDVIVEEETRAERERQAKIEAELARVENLQARIGDIRNSVERVLAFGAPDLKQVAKEIEGLERLTIDESFAEFQQQAKDAKDATLSRLRELHKAAVEREAEAKRIAEERAELEKLRAAEAARQEEERKAREAAEAAAEKKRKAEEAKRRAELETAQKKQAEEQARIDAENKRLADERAKFERQQEAAREREREAERTRQAEAAAEQKRREKAAADAKKAKFPGEAAIVEAIAEHFDVTAEVARKWLSELRKRKAA
jgi:hypothetical protein